MKKADIGALDRLFSRYVRLLSGGYCKKCGKYCDIRDMDNAHFHSRKGHITRWDIKNVAALCKKCHAEIDAHINLKYELFYELLGKEEFDKLNERAEILRPDIDLEALKIKFKEKIKMLEVNNG